MDIAQLSLRFKNFATLECRDSSPLYECLSLRIAEDDQLLKLAAFAKNGQPIPNLFFGAIHHLLLEGAEHRLRDYYPTIVNSPKSKEQAFPFLKDFCLHYRKEIIALLENKIVQTNEVRRCSYLYPSFSYIHDHIRKPLALIEIGTSAGLQLLWDQYSYSYGNNEIYGDKKSKVHITSIIKGDNFPKFPSSPPPVSSRVGLDLHINDINKEEDYLWLKSLIWPEHKERIELFEKAAMHMKDNPVKLIEGDGVALLPTVAGSIPADEQIVIFHTHVANQMPKELKLDLLDKIKEIGRKRDVFHLYNNIWDGKLHLDSFVSGIEENRTIGESEGHGRWFSWELIQ